MEGQGLRRPRCLPAGAPRMDMNVCLMNRELIRSRRICGCEAARGFWSLRPSCGSICQLWVPCVSSITCGCFTDRRSPLVSGRACPRVELLNYRTASAEAITPKPYDCGCFGESVARPRNRRPVVLGDRNEVMVCRPGLSSARGEGRVNRVVRYQYCRSGHGLAEGLESGPAECQFVHHS